MSLIRRIARSAKYRGARLFDAMDIDTRLANRIREKRRAVKHGAIEMTLAVPNFMCRFRAKSFSSKEPETLAWIDGFEKGSVFWDVGANVGIYSIYAAKAAGCRVFAFEPSVFNLEFLARNSYLNGLSDKVCLVPLALGDATGAGKLHMTTTDWGGALSTFGQTYGSDGQPLVQVFEYSTISISMDEAVERLRIPVPHYVKIDVDGIEHLILAGGNGVLKQVRGVLVEISKGFREQADLANKLLEQAGLVMDRAAGGASTEAQGTVNQVWVRP